MTNTTPMTAPKRLPLPPLPLLPPLPPLPPVRQLMLMHPLAPQVRTLFFLFVLFCVYYPTFYAHASNVSQHRAPPAWDMLPSLAPTPFLFVPSCSYSPLGALVWLVALVPRRPTRTSCCADAVDGVSSSSTAAATDTISTADAEGDGTTVETDAPVSAAFSAATSALVATFAAAGLVAAAL